MARWLRQIGGAGLLLAAAAGLVYWEIDGRDRLLTEDVLVAVRDIDKGAVITSDMFIDHGVMEDDIIKDALKPVDAAVIEGSRSRQFIPGKSQITGNFFQKDEFFIDSDESVFVIRPEWISMISSSIRQGDRVRLLTEDGAETVGSFYVAFAKDNTFREVKNAYTEEGDPMANEKDTVSIVEKGSADASGNSRGGPAEILERTDASSVADHIEIIATLSQYREILQLVGGSAPRRLMIVQE